MSKAWKMIAVEKLKSASSDISLAKEKALEKFDESGVKDAIGKRVSGVKTFLDEKGITEAAIKITSTVDDQLDTLSGNRLLQLVEERLSLQSRYNDILATRLDDALSKIQRLESELRELKASEVRDGHD